MTVISMVEEVPKSVSLCRAAALAVVAKHEVERTLWPIEAFRAIRLGNKVLRRAKP
jgi:hypothetical protein